MSVQSFRSRLFTLLCGVPLVLAWLVPSIAWAGPVEWREVPSTAEGRQWWDGGSLRLSRQGQLTVLSRFQPAPSTPDGDGRTERPAPSQLYVMELDCGQELYRDISVNGLPRFRAEWQAAAGDALSTATLRAACQAGADLLAAAPKSEASGG
jgi:hypothetical protein